MWIFHAVAVLRGGGVCLREGAFLMRRLISAGEVDEY
jgi:hypothetical protein